MIQILYRFRNAGFFNTFGRISSTSKYLISLFLCLFTLHVIAMMTFEGWPLEVALWFTVTAGTTVGFGDYFPVTTAGRLATVFLIYVPTIPTIAFLTGRLVEKVISRRDRILKGNWKWKMSEHIVFINFPDQGGDVFFSKIMEEFKNSSSGIRERQVIIVTDKMPNGLSQKLSDLGIKLVTGRPNSEATLHRASIVKADKVVILCEDPNDSRSDSLVYDIASLIRELGSTEAPEIIAEATMDTTKIRLKNIGVRSVIRPIRAYPELVARTIISPGSEQVIENIFDSSNEECLKFSCNYKGTWSDLVIELITRDYGTPIAVETNDGIVRANLRSGDHIDTKAVFMIVPEGNERASRYNKNLLAPV